MVSERMKSAILSVSIGLNERVKETLIFFHV